MAERLLVVAAIIERDGHFLVTKRPAGVHLEGHWEFPGGKCEPGESAADGLRREIREELDAEIAVEAEMSCTSHEYPEQSVLLRFFRCSLAGEPRPALGQDMRWVSKDQLADLSFPPADAEIVARLRADTPRQ